MPEPHEVFAAEQAKEYGQYVATEAIFVGTARAFNVDDPVPASHVGRVVREDQVAKTTTKAGQAAAEKG